MLVFRAYCVTGDAYILNIYYYMRISEYIVIITLYCNIVDAGTVHPVWDNSLCLSVDNPKCTVLRNYLCVNYL